MLRSAFRTCLRPMLSRRIEFRNSSKLIRHLDATNTSNVDSKDRQSSRVPSISAIKPFMPKSAAIGVGLSNQYFGINMGGNSHLSSRNFSSFTEKVTSCEQSSPEAEMAKFEEAATATAEVFEAWEPTWMPQDQILDLIVKLNEAAPDTPLPAVIFGLTLAIRTAMVPLFVIAQQNSSRMAHVKPEMDVIQQKMQHLNKNDIQGQQKLGMEMQTLFQKYNCNPLKSLLILPIQMPVFMGTFFALKKFPDIYPEKLVDSGILWFQDLAAPDPYGILPITSALSFLLMMELGKSQMLSTNPAQGQVLLNFFRAIAVLMVPFTWNFPSVIFCYWTANNTFSLIQSAALNNPAVRKSLDIWEPPKPVPGAPAPKGMKELMDEFMEKRRNNSSESNFKERIKMHNVAVEKKNADKMKTNLGAGRLRKKNRGKK